MSDLKLYGHIFSQPVISVLSYCDLSGISYTFHEINLIQEEHTTDEFTKINPFQQIPAIVHNGFNLWESAAIIPYLADAYNINNQWYPKDIKIRARIASYMHWHHSEIRGPIIDYLRAKVGGPKLMGWPQLTEEAEIPYRNRLVQLLNNVAWILSDTGYIARTPGPTIADIHAFAEIASASIISIDLSTHPSVMAWFGEIGSIPRVQEICRRSQEYSEKFYKSG